MKNDQTSSVYFPSKAIYIIAPKISRIYVLKQKKVLEAFALTMRSKARQQVRQACLAMRGQH